MAESTLNDAFADLQIEIGKYLGYGRGASPDPAWSNAQAADIDACIKRGVRQMYSPKFLPGQAIAHEWSFLRPTTTLTTSPPYSTGTAAVTNGSTTVNFTSSVLPAWAASGVITINGSTTYGVSVRNGDTQATLDTAWQGDNGSGLTFILSQLDYDLPDGFGGLIDAITYGHGVAPFPIDIVGEGHIRQFRQRDGFRTGQPRLAALRAKPVPASTTVGQRWEILFDVAPDAVYVLTYSYYVLPDKLTTSNAYAYGGAQHAETLLASCLAIAEMRLNDTKGVYASEFLERLAASISIDLRNQPKRLPRRGNPWSSDYGRIVRDHIVTVNGQIP